MTVRTALLTALVALAVLAAPGAASAQGQVPDVNVFTDEATQPGCTVDHCTLRERVDEALTADTITLEAGTYELTQGEPLNLDRAMQIEGAGARSTTIDAGGTSQVGHVDDEALVTVVGVTVTGGDADAGDNPSMGNGGAFRVEPSAGLILAQTTLTGNRASATGGAVSNWGDLQFIESTATGNVVEGGSPALGGGIYSVGEGAVLFNSTISDNVAGGPGAARGGGVYVADGSSLEHVTIAGNTAAEGSGLYEATGQSTLSATLLAGNTDAECAGETPAATDAHSLAEDDSCGFGGTGSLEEVDARLAPLADYGGPTDTHALFAGSPAIDAADAQRCPVQDQRLFDRPPGPCDIGAFEGSVAAEPVRLDSSPLDLWADGLGRLQVRLDGEPDGMFYPPSENAANAGLEIVTGADHYGLGVGRLPISAPEVGAAGDEQSITSAYRIGRDLVVTERLLHEPGTQVFNVEYDLRNTSDLPVDLRAGELADLYIGGDDTGSGFYAEASEFRFVGGRSADGLITGMVERTPWTRFQEGFYGDVFQNFAAGGLDDTWLPDPVDNGVGVEWELTLPPGEQRTLAVTWRIGLETRVNATGDDDDGTCLAPPSGDCTLREAVRHGLPGSDVVLPAGDYQLTEALDVDRDVAIVGDGARETVIRGAAGARVLAVSQDVSISGVRITGGDVSDEQQAGGGIYVASQGQLTVVETTIDGNAAASGGGIYSAGSLIVERSTITGNDAIGPEPGDGGGVFVSGGAATIENSTISANDSSNEGAGLYNQNGIVDLRNVTFAANDGDEGGAIYHDVPGVTDARATLRNVLIAIGEGGACGGDAVHAIGTLAEDGTCAGADVVGGAGIGGLLANNGPTDTHALLPGSPAIDAGANCFDGDQRGVERPQGAACDVGAFELEADTALTVTTRVVNDNGGTLAPGDVLVRLLARGNEVDAAPGNPQGKSYALVAGEYVVSPPARSGYTVAVGGACGSDGRVLLTADAECVVSYDDVATSGGGGGGGGGTQDPPPGLPEPVAGKTLNVLPAAGTVKVRVPGTNRFVVLAAGQSLPVGTIVDALKGRVTLVAAGGQTATFYDGIFKIGQGKGAKPLTTLTLVEALSCKTGKASAAAKKKTKRRLWGDGSGRFETKGKHSAATVVGTQVARRGPLRLHADQGRARQGLGSRLHQEEDGAREGRQAVRRAAEELADRLLTGA